MLLNLVAKMKFYTLLYFIIWLPMAILLWLQLFHVWFDFIFIVSCSWRNHIILLLMLETEKMLLLLVISLTAKVVILLLRKRLDATLNVIIFKLFKNIIHVVCVLLWSSYDRFNNSDHMTHWERNKMTAISQTTFSSALSWTKCINFD